MGNNTISSNVLSKIVDNVENVIVGKRTSIELALIALICNGHVLVEDMPGVGKTTMVSALAKSINGSFKRIQFTPDILPSDITGFSMYNQKLGEFIFREGAVMSNIILADEINRTSPKTQASLLEIMEERQVTVDGITHSLPSPFMVMATQNPIEYLGTYPLPEAQLDRFFLKLSLGYPSSSDEVEILRRFKSGNPAQKVLPVAELSDIEELQLIVRDIHIDSSLLHYIVEIVSLTRKHEDISLGSSPRGSIYLQRAAQGYALYKGRSYVIPDDIKKMATSVLSHRLILRQEAKIRKVSPSDIISDILTRVRIPAVDNFDKK